MESAPDNTAQAHTNDTGSLASQPASTMDSSDSLDLSAPLPARAAPPSLSVPCNLAFPVQSEPSTPNATPASSFTSSDRFAHTRGKRRRTSPEDSAILEAEYERNQKPDKKARAEVVARVSMTDKEVQIWFQNRRQITRRKARTWQPNAITSIIRESHRQGLSENKSTSSSFPTSSQSSSQSQFNSSRPQSSHDENVDRSTQSCKGAEERTNETFTGYSAVEQQAHIEKSLKTWEAQEKEQGQSQESVSTSPNLPNDASLVALGSEKGSSNDSEAQGLGITSGHDEQQPSSSVEVVGHGQSSEAKHATKRRSVRLVCSEDGLAEVVLKSASVTPEKPKLKPTTADAVPSIHGGEMALSQPLPASSSQPTPISLSQPTPASANSLHASSKPRAHGRSRDARAWEFYCDSDSREALTTLADRECKGSALGKLSLIRSNSAGSKPLLPTKKHNTQSVKDEQTKRKDTSGLDKQRPKLARTSSSLARLQHIQDKGVAGQLGTKKTKGLKDMAIFEDPDGDSDKENWEPGTQISRPRYRSFANPARVNTILRTNPREISHSSSQGAMMGRERARKSGPHWKPAAESSLPYDKENTQVDEEVAQFMGDESYVQGGDVDDAVHSLLSLSQGEWR